MLNFTGLFIRLLKEKQQKIKNTIMRNVLVTGVIDIVGISESFGVLQRIVCVYVEKLVKEKKIEKSCGGYSPLFQFRNIININGIGKCDEDEFYKEYIEPDLPKNLKSNVRSILRFGFQEIFNNVISHTGASSVRVIIVHYDIAILILISDNGAGIFDNIQKTLKLESQRECMLELTKGTFSSDPEKHTGRGIFYISRIFNIFAIFSNGSSLSGTAGKVKSDINSTLSTNDDFTTNVFMMVYTDTEITTDDILSQYVDKEEMEHDKTEISLAILSEGGNDLISRAQARRLLASLDKFKVVTLDFSGIEEIGISFADEIFRVFKNANPDTLIMPVNSKPAVEKIINRAKNWEK